MLTVEYRGNTLLGIPAVHNRTVFAEMVNRACASEQPQAIAVELDPSGAAAVADWLMELGVAPGGKPLPCMLGLVRRNYRIHPRFKAAALRLQETTGRQLYELPPNLLYKELGYAAVGLLCLTPTDSIVEACRAALELKVPLYGIDLDHPVSPVERPGTGLRDPLAARGDLAGYVRRLGSQADLARDAHGDGRREIAMAARLKRLLLDYGQVLVTCGAAHWENLCRLLADERVRPVRKVPGKGTVHYRRVLVHPLLAIQQMDLVPPVAVAYEGARQAVSDAMARRDALDFAAQFRACLEGAVGRYAGAAADGGPDSIGNLQGVAGYTRYLLDLCLLRQTPVPDMHTALTAAQAMMPLAFVRALNDTLMAFPWATTERFPDLPIIGPDMSAPARAGQAERRAALKMRQTGIETKDGEAPAYIDSEPFYLSPMHEDTGAGTREFGWRWRDEPRMTRRQSWQFTCNFVWPPCEYLFYATIYEAIRIADASAGERVTEPYTGSLQDGIDVKATMRSALLGKGQLMVKRRVKAHFRRAGEQPVAASYTPTLELQPTVFILPGGRDDTVGSWHCLNAGTAKIYHDLSERGKRLFDARLTPGEYSFIESISYAERAPVPKPMRPWVESLSLLHGAVRFGNPCINFYQGSRWLEFGRFKSAPILPGYWSMDKVLALYRERDGLVIDPKDWRNALILFALPYAQATRRVVVVCPRAFRIGDQVRREARRCQVELVVIPIARFPADRIERIRRQYAVAAGQGGKEFPPELEVIFGEPESAYRDLLPPEVRRQTRPRSTPSSGSGPGRPTSDLAVAEALAASFDSRPIAPDFPRPRPNT